MRPVLLLLSLGFSTAAQASPPAINYVLGDPAANVEAVAVDSAGNTYLTGATASTTFPATAGAFQVQPGGGSCLMPVGFGEASTPCTDAFVIKLNATGAVAWATYLGGNSNDIGTRLLSTPRAMCMSEEPLSRFKV